MALVQPPKICPLMSNGSDTRYCDNTCQLFVRHRCEEQNKTRQDCALLLLIAGGISRKDL